MNETNIIEKKRELRKKYREIRNNISEDYATYAANLLTAAFIENIILKRDCVIAGYIPRDGEINVIPLMQRLQSLGHQIVIPVIDKNSNCLLFQKWNVDNQFLALSIIEDSMIPNIVITPLIAFDQNLNRLGFGGGWYDRTIAKLRPFGCRFIGVAYHVQFYTHLPIEDHDQVLDHVITDNINKVIKVTR